MLPPFALALLVLQERAFVEVQAPAEVVVGERVRVTLRIGLEQRFLDEELIQPFRQALDVPVQVAADWIEPQAAGEEGLTLAVNGGVRRARPAADRDADGRTFRVFELEQELATDEPGHLVLEAPVLRYAYATRFRDDLLQGRVPEDRTDGSVAGEPRTVAVLDPPTEGRPPEYAGAVGAFTLRARIDPVDSGQLEVGQSFRLVLTLEGRGNLAAVEPPRLDDLDGLHNLGRLEAARDGAREWTYDLAPKRADVREVPPIRFAFYEPGVGYRVVATDAIPLRVRAGVEEPATAPAEGPSTLAILVGVGIAALVAGGLALRRLSGRAARGSR